MVEELKVKLTADVDSFKKGMKDARDSLEETTDQGEEAQSSFKRMARTMESISPSFKAAADKWRESSEKLGSTFSKNSKLAKGFKLAGLAAIGGVVAEALVEVTKAIVEAAKKVWEFAKDTAKMYDPQGYSKSAGAVEKSMKKLKTAIGSFTAPIVNVLNNVFSKIIDGVTWIVEKVRIGIAYVTGIVKAVFEPVVNGIRQVVTWVQGAINVLGNFLGMGDIFKKASDSAADTADSMGEVVEATSAGLASFDKLTTLNFDGMGDAEEAEKISDAIGEADQSGQNLIKGIDDWLARLDMSRVWDDFVQGCIDVKDRIINGVTGWFTGATQWASEMWAKFVTGCGDVATGIAEAVVGWFTNAAIWASDMWSKFVTACSDISTSIVESVAGWFSGAAQWATDTWDAFVTACKDMTAKVVEAIVGWFTDAATWASDVWIEFVTACSDLATKIAEAIVGWFTNASTWASDVWSEFVTACTNLKNDIVNAIVGWFGNAATWASDMWDKFVEGCTNVKNDIVDKVLDWFGNATTWASDMWDKFVEECGNIKKDITEKIPEWFAKAGTWAKDLWDKFVEGCNNVKTDVVDGVVGWFSELPEKMMKIGKQVIEGLAKGITDTIGGVADTITSGIDKVIGGVKSFLGIHSPSTLMRDEIGVNIGLGIQEGVLSTEDSLVAESMGMVERVSNQIRSALDASVAQLEAEYNAAVSDIVSGSGVSSGSSGSSSSSSNGSSSGSEPKEKTVSDYRYLLSKRYVELSEDIAAAEEKWLEAVRTQDLDNIDKWSKVRSELSGAMQEAAYDYYTTKSMPTQITAGGKTYYASSDTSEYDAKRKAEIKEKLDQLSPTMSNIVSSIMGLAGGGAIAPGNPQPYILGDNRREYEVVSPVSLMEQTVMSAMRKMGMGTSGQSDRPIEVSIELDGRKMARALYDPMETEKRRRGVRA